MKSPKIDISNGCLAFLCAYCVFDPRGSFLLFLLSVGVHELGHLLTLRYLHVPVKSIQGTLSGFEIRTDPLSYRQEILVAASGPGMNLILCLLTKETCPIMAIINTVLLLYNLLPIYPLDGGRILRSSLFANLIPPHAERIEQCCSLTVFICIFLGSVYLSFTYRCGMWPILFCAFLFYRLGETILPKRKISLDKIIIP